MWRFKWVERSWIRGSDWVRIQGRGGIMRGKVSSHGIEDCRRKETSLTAVIYGHCNQRAIHCGDLSAYIPGQNETFTLWQEKLLYYNQRNCYIIIRETYIMTGETYIMTGETVILWQEKLLYYDRRNCYIMTKETIILWQEKLLYYGWILYITVGNFFWSFRC